MRELKKTHPAITQQVASTPESTDNKFAIVLEGGKTIIFISDKSKEEEIRDKYRLYDSKNF